MTYDDHQPNPRFQRGNLGLRLVLLGAMSICLMWADARFHHLDQIRRVLSAVVYPVQLVVDAPASMVAWVGDNFRDQRSLRRENAALRQRQQELGVGLLRLSALEAENARLRALMDSTARISDRVLHGEIMAVDIDDRFRHRVVIDRGLHAGAFPGQALVNAEGIVGQVLRADDMTSEAILISDPSHAIPVAVNRTGLLTIAYGTGDTGRLNLPFVPKSADIREGDLLVTSGLGGSFPANYPVARVSSIDHHGDESFATVEAEPAARLNQTRELLLVWSQEGAGTSGNPATLTADASASSSTKDDADAKSASSALTASTLER
ncbi:MAG: rod shape-determining protein MreC [Pseudomonadota bacterium]